MSCYSVSYSYMSMVFFFLPVHFSLQEKGFFGTGRFFPLRLQTETSKSCGVKCCVCQVNVFVFYLWLCVSSQCVQQANDQFMLSVQSVHVVGK